jgi:matrix metalloproteinase-14 (membrane-inserted)
MVAESVQNNNLSVVNWGNGKAFFFKGNQYIRFDIAADKADAGYPKPIKDHWSGLEAFADGIDAAVNWRNGKAFFFKGNQYICFDIAASKADAGYPRLIKDHWSGLEAFADGIDAAVNLGNGKAFFFKGNQYIRFNIAAEKADAGYPKPINNSNWPGLEAFADGIDAAVSWRNGKAFFFKGNQYIRFNIAADKADAGYPKPINNSNWPGLTFGNQGETPLNPAKSTTGEFQIPTNSITGVEFTNKLSKDSSYKFTPSGTWKPQSDVPECNAAGLKGFSPEIQTPLSAGLAPYQQHLKYPNNTFFALLAVDKTTGAVTEVGKETTIVLKSGQTLTFVVNDFPTAYENNTGTLAVKWSAS